MGGNKRRNKRNKKIVKKEEEERIRRENNEKQIKLDKFKEHYSRVVENINKTAIVEIKKYLPRFNWEMKYWIRKKSHETAKQWMKNPNGKIDMNIFYTELMNNIENGRYNIAFEREEFELFVNDGLYVDETTYEEIEKIIEEREKDPELQKKIKKYNDSIREYTDKMEVAVRHYYEDLVYKTCLKMVQDEVGQEKISEWIQQFQFYIKKKCVETAVKCVSDDENAEFNVELSDLKINSNITKENPFYWLKKELDVKNILETIEDKKVFEASMKTKNTNMFPSAWFLIGNHETKVCLENDEKNTNE